MFQLNTTRIFSPASNRFMFISASISSFNVESISIKPQHNIRIGRENFFLEVFKRLATRRYIHSALIINKLKWLERVASTDNILHHNVMILKVVTNYFFFVQKSNKNKLGILSISHRIVVVSQISSQR